MLEHPEGKIIHICAGRIIRFINDENDKPNYRFEHSLSTEHGSSGSPLILLYNERVIGVHRGVVSEEKEKDGKKITIERNFGSFIGEMINAINDKIDEDRQLKEKKELKGFENNIKNYNNEKNESEENLIKYMLNGEIKYAKLSDTIKVTSSDIISFNFPDNPYKK